MNGTLIRDAIACQLLRLAAASVALSTAVACAQYCTPDECDQCNMWQRNLHCCYEPPELWVVNTRCAPKCSNLDEGFNRIKFQRYDAQCGRFVDEPLESFLAEERSMPSMIYVHGNSLDHESAMEACWWLYDKMRCCPGQKRLVFWSWPAERVFKNQRFRVGKMIMKNMRIKFDYAEYQGYYLARLVQKMSLSQRVTLAGHSYGAITASAALHWLGGGRLCGLTLEGGMPLERHNLRAGILAGAFDNDALVPGHRYGQAFVAAEKIWITRNADDRALRGWPIVSKRGCQAIGVTGVNANRLRQYRPKLCQQTSAPEVGKKHQFKTHLEHPRIVAALCCLSFPGGAQVTSNSSKETQPESKRWEAPGFIRREAHLLPHNETMLAGETPAT